MSKHPATSVRALSVALLTLGGVLLGFVGPASGTSAVSKSQIVIPMNRTAVFKGSGIKCNAIPKAEVRRATGNTLAVPVAFCTGSTHAVMLTHDDLRFYVAANGDLMESLRLGAQMGGPRKPFPARWSKSLPRRSVIRPGQTALFRGLGTCSLKTAADLETEFGTGQWTWLPLSVLCTGPKHEGSFTVIDRQRVRFFSCFPTLVWDSLEGGVGPGHRCN